MKRITICLITLIMLLSIGTNVFAKSDFMGLTDTEWKTYLEQIVNKAESTDGTYSMTADETYMYERAYSDYNSYYYQTDKSIDKKYNYTSYLKNSSLSKDIKKLLKKIDKYNKTYREIIESPNYYEDDDKKTEKEIYSSADRRYWVKAIGNLYIKEITDKELTQTEKKDLEILKKLRKSNYNFGSITKQEAAIYSKYLIRSNDRWEKTSAIYEFNSFNEMIDSIEYQEEKKEETDKRNNR